MTKRMALGYKGTAQLCYGITSKDGPQEGVLTFHLEKETVEIHRQIRMQLYMQWWKVSTLLKGIVS